MNSRVATRRSDDGTELQAGLTDWSKSRATKFYDQGISKLVHRYDKYLSAYGDYAE